MDWWAILLIIFGSLVVLMMSGMPIAFCFMFIAAAGVFLLWGGQTGLIMLGLQVFSSLASFTLLPIALFILMGEIIFQSKLAYDIVDTVDKWLGRLPGRLSLVAVAAGTIFATLTGASTASTAMLGASLVPDMEKRGYKKPMSLGPILGSGGLAFMIPPSGLAVFLGAIAEISIGKLLIAIIIPGLLMAILYAAYIIIRCWLQPSIAPAYTAAPVSLSEKLIATAKYILPTGIIIFLVVGVIFLGIASPSEAAATGVLGCFILVAGSGRLSWKVVKNSFANSMHIIVMVFLIISAAKAYSQILAFSGASMGLIKFATSLPVVPIVTIIAMQVVALILGMFMPTSAMIMVAVPLFAPVVAALGFSNLWWGVLFMLALEMAVTSPPYGINLFVIKTVAPPGTTTGDCIRAALPFLGCDLISMALLIAFPAIILWLPSVMS